MKTTTTFFKYLFTLVILLNFRANAQWTQVWSDEFNTSTLDGSNWTIEIGTGPNGDGWGNNEQQYYRAENIAVAGGALQITARRENFGGKSYTSGRLKTQGKRSWQYGKMEARIAMPNFQGVWPAFWMLGNNISSVPWPSCGEIDIMEHINTGDGIFGTIHWSDGNGNYANYTGNAVANSSINNYHTYAVEWDASLIKWFLNGVKYHEVNIAGGVNGTSEFHQHYFFLLNMAIGGTWPGFTIDNNAFPKTMFVDYVRVFKPSGIVSGAKYSFINVHSNKSMEVAGVSTANGANVQQWDYVGGGHQQWRVTDVGGGYYSIINIHSGKSLDVSNVSTANGANIHQWDYVGGNNQKWQILGNGDGTYRIISAHSGKAVDVANVSVANGGNIHQWDYVGGNNQKWRINYVSARLAAPEVVSSESKLHLYPNPVTKNLFIDSGEDLTGAQFQIISTQGKEILKGVSSENGIDVSNLKPGVYNITINANGKKITKRFIKD